MDPNLYILLKGVLIGLAIAMPVGPLNVLCISRTLKGGFMAGVPVLLGTSLADATYAIIAVLGLTAISDFLISHQLWLRFFGGLVLLWMGVKALRHPPKANSTIKVSKMGFLKDVMVIYGITISSPLTIVSFAALFASLGVSEFQAPGSAGLLLVGGVMLGTFSWMMVLTISSVAVRKKAGDGLLVKLNKLGGVILIGFALALFLSVSGLF